MFILKGYEIGFSIRVFWVRTYWVSHMGLTKTMPEFGKYPFHKPGKNDEM